MWKAEGLIALGVTLLVACGVCKFGVRLAGGTAAVLEDGALLAGAAG